MQVNTLILTAITAVLVMCLSYGPRLAGQWMARQELQRLRAKGADPNHRNPPAQSEAFDGTLSAVWAFNLINGAGKIGHAPEFHNTRLASDHGLTISQHFDPDFAREPREKRYNNATLIGFQGYQPTPREDVVFEARIQVSPNFYGSAGMMVQPRGTILEDGSFMGPFKNQAFTLFGICFLGPESNLFGQNGATVERVINWWPEAVQGLRVDMHEFHTYQLRLHWIDEQTWLGTTAVDGQVVSTLPLPPFGPLELHLWSDNYLLKTGFNGAPKIGLQNGIDKWVHFEKVSAWTEAAAQ